MAIRNAILSELKETISDLATIVTQFVKEHGGSLSAKTSLKHQVPVYLTLRLWGQRYSIAFVITARISAEHLTNCYPMTVR